MSCRGGSDSRVVRVFSKVSNGGVVGFVHGLGRSCGVWCCVCDFDSSYGGIVVYECGLDSNGMWLVVVVVVMMCV